MKVLLRNQIPTPAMTPNLTIVDGVVTQGSRVYTLKTAPGVYFVMPYQAGGTVPHPNDKETFTASWRELRDCKELMAAMNASFYRGFIAAYVVQDSGEVVLLVNTVVTPAPDVATFCEVITQDLAKMANDSILRPYYPNMPTQAVAGAKTNLLRHVVLNDQIANLQLQVDLLMKVMISNPPAVKPEWWDAFVSAMSGMDVLPNPLDRKGVDNAIVEIKKDRAALNTLIAAYINTKQ